MNTSKSLQNLDRKKDEETMPSSQGTLSSNAIRHKNWIPVLICLALAMLTVISFWSLKDCGFINFDDDVYVYENAYVQSGLNANNVEQAFSFSSELVEKSGNWIPVIWLSLMLDYQIFGLNPAGFHLVNLLFHILNTILLFLVLRRMTKSLWSSAFVAALFAIHPLRVESVAWITERKDVLSAFFWMLTLGAYNYYVEHPGVRRYFLVLLFFALGLMAKPMLITLPFVLLLLDYWPLNRFREVQRDHIAEARVMTSATSEKQKKKFKTKRAAREILEIKKPADPEYRWSLIYPLLWEKVPLFVLAILSSIVTYIAQKNVGAVQSIEVFPLGVRIGNAFISYIAYIGKMIWPGNLSVFYPYPKFLVLWQVWGSVFLLAAVTLVVCRRVKKSPYLATGWLWYLGTLVPVIGIVQVGGQAMADRYTYIPLTGLFIIIAWSVPDLLKKLNHRQEILWTSSALIILCFSITTWMQVGYWRNSITLFNQALEVTDHNWRAFNNLAAAYNKLGDYKQAIENYNKTIEIKPAYAEVYNNRGAVYENLGNYRQAIEDYDRAVEIKPDYAEAYNNRGNAHDGLGNYKQAVEDYNRAIELKPDYAEAYYNRGVVYLNQGDEKRGCDDAKNACARGVCKLLEESKGKGLCR